MRERLPTEDELRDRHVAYLRETAYGAVCPPMNRSERRTARGRMLVAQAEAAALRAEVEYLRSELSAR